MQPPLLFGPCVTTRRHTTLGADLVGQTNRTSLVILFYFIFGVPARGHPTGRRILLVHIKPVKGDIVTDLKHS